MRADHPKDIAVAKNTDARLSTTLPNHPKTLKMKRRLGAAGPLGIIYLILHAAAEKPDGDLTSMDDEEIELAAQWDGEPGAFIAAAVQVKFLEAAPGGGYVLHDWADHQPWAAGADDRADNAKWAALCRRYGRDGAAERMPSYAARMRVASDRHGAAREAQSEPHAPSPTVSDTDTVSDTTPTSTKRPARAVKPRPPVGGEAYSPAFLRFWEAYPEGKRSKKLDAWKSWQRDNLDEFADTIILDVNDRKVRHWGWVKDGGAYIPGAQVYLNGRRWNDAIEPIPARGAGRQSQLEDGNRQRAEAWAEEGA